MALPPQLLACVRPVRVEPADELRHRVIVGDRPLPASFRSADEARDAGTAEVVRLDAIALALVRRIRAPSRRKQR